MKQSVYDPSLRLTESGRRLYEIWKRIRREGCDPCFDTFPVFYEWALSTDYIAGDKLLRYDESMWYSPENSYWFGPTHAQISPTWKEEWCKKWDKTVNVIRRHFGLPEF